jgi:glycine cleavage system H protein
MYAKNRAYSKDHEWIEASDGEAVLGITQYAQEELGDVVFVELPEVGARFEAGDEIGTVESVKAVAEIYSPVTGTVLEVNGKVQDAPELLNEDPHGEGWLVRLRLSDEKQLTSLMSSEQYEEFIAGGAQ